MGFLSCLHSEMPDLDVFPWEDQSERLVAVSTQ